MAIIYSFLNPFSRWYYPLRWLVLIFLGLVIYAQTFGFNFVFDDFLFIVNNPYIKRFDYVPHVLRIYPATRLLGFYSFAFNYSINQLHPQGYHIFNFIIHLLTAGLVWALVTVLFKIRGWVPQEFPFIIAVLFLIHPCQTQAVTYVSQRFESLATLFYIGSIYTYLCGRISSSKRRQIFLFTCCVGFAVLGMFTKEVAVTISLMVLAVEFILFNRSPLNLKGPSPWKLYLVIAALGLVFVLLFMKIVRADFINEYFTFSIPSSSHDGDFITGSKYVLTQMRVFLTFMRLLILPINQNLDYDYPLSTGLLSPPLTLIGIGLIGFMVFLIFRLRQQWPLIAFGLAWILITFLINTAPRTNVIFEHKLYLISFGFFLAIVCALSTIIKDRRILFGILTIFIAVLSITSFKRNQVWKNELTLWQDVTQKSPHKARGFCALGVLHTEQGNFVQAQIDFNKAIEMNPRYATAFCGRAILYAKQDDFERAFADFTKAIKLDPNHAEAYNNRSNIYAQRGDLTSALSDLNKSIAINPGYAEAYLNRGNFYYRKNNFTQAIADYTKALELNPQLGIASSSLAAIYNQEAWGYFKQGNFKQAILDYSEVIKLNPNDAKAYNNRGNAYDIQGNHADATSDFKK